MVVADAISQYGSSHCGAFQYVIFRAASTQVDPGLPVAWMAAFQDLAIFQVDAFSKQPFCGNPAAVCLVPTGIDIPDPLLQQIAAENNLSETAFIFESEPGSFASKSKFHLRWLTPTKEVQLCGHATLAAASVLFAELENPSDALEFDTLSGVLVVRRGSASGSLSMDFPMNQPRPVPDEVLPVGECLPTDSVQFSQAVLLFLPQVARCLMKLILGDEKLCGSHVYNRTTKKLVLVLAAGSDLLSQLAPDPRALLEAHDGSMITGVSVTCAGEQDSDLDFYSRYFAPWNGIEEDPVNGSSHTILAPFWSEKLGGKDTLLAKQLSKRSGELHLQLQSDANRFASSCSFHERSIITP